MPYAPINTAAKNINCSRLSNIVARHATSRRAQSTAKTRVIVNHFRETILKQMHPVVVVAAVARRANPTRCHASHARLSRHASLAPDARRGIAVERRVITHISSPIPRLA